MTVLQGDRVCVVTASLHHCITASLHHCIAASLHHCITASLYHYITAWLHRYITTLLQHCISTSVSAHWFCRFDCKSLGAITASLHHYMTASLHNYIIASLHHCITASCITASKNTRNQGVGFFSSISKKWINTALCSDTALCTSHMTYQHQPVL
jgi:hypothetical protein